MVRNTGHIHCACNTKQIRSSFLAEDLTPRKKMLIGMLNDIKENMVYLSNQNSVLRKRNLELEGNTDNPGLNSNACGSDKKFKAAAFGKASSYLKKYKIFDRISVGPCNLLVCNGLSLGERKGAEDVEKTKESSAQNIKSKTEKAFHILKLYVSRIYEIHGCSSLLNTTRDRQLQEEKEVLAVQLQNLTLEVLNNRVCRKDSLSAISVENMKNGPLNEHKKKRNKTRMEQFVKLGCFCSSAPRYHILLFFCCSGSGKTFYSSLRQLLNAFKRKASPLIV